jgi:hypothetical protein
MSCLSAFSVPTSDVTKIVFTRKTVWTSLGRTIWLRYLCFS